MRRTYKLKIMDYNYLNLHIPLDSGVYWPKEDTDLCIEVLDKWITTFKLNKTIQSKIHILDMGTGPGTLILYLAMRFLNDSQYENNKCLIGIDINPKAIYLAKKNAKNNKLEDSCTFLLGSLLTPLRKHSIKTHFEVILFNAPYLPDEEDIIDESNSLPLDSSWKGGKKGDEITLEFLQQIHNYQNRDKPYQLFLTSSSQVNQESLTQQFSKMNLKIKKIYKKHIFFEDIILYHLIYNPLL